MRLGHTSVVRSPRTRAIASRRLSSDPAAKASLKSSGSSFSATRATQLGLASTHRRPGPQSGALPQPVGRAQRQRGPPGISFRQGELGRGDEREGHGLGAELGCPRSRPPTPPAALEPRRGDPPAPQARRAAFVPPTRASWLPNRPPSSLASVRCARAASCRPSVISSNPTVRAAHAMNGSFCSAEAIERRRRGLAARHRSHRRSAGSTRRPAAPRSRDTDRRCAPRVVSIPSIAASAPSSSPTSTAVTAEISNSSACARSSSASARWQQLLGSRPGLPACDRASARTARGSGTCAAAARCHG